MSADAARAQQPGGPAADDSRLPSAADCARAFHVARQWIDPLDTPRMNDAASHVKINGATGVCVVLRRSGKVMGIGIDVAGDDLMLRHAVGSAINELFSDPALEALSARLVKQQTDDPKSALTVDALRSEIGKTITLEIEFAGATTPLVGRSIDQVAAKIDPGLDGVALRDRQQFSYVFPAQLRATNAGAEPNRLLLNLALKAGVPMQNPDSLVTRDDMGVYSFRCVTLAQPMPQAPPSSLVRGDTLIPQNAVDRQTIAEFADGVAQHLLATMWPDPPQLGGDESKNAAPLEREPLGLMGNYSPIADQFEPLLAPPLDQALAALALSRYANASRDGINAELATKADRAATQIIHDLSILTSGENDPRSDLAACAATIIAISSQPKSLDDESVANLFDDTAQRVVQSFAPASGFLERTKANQPAQRIGPHTQAMLAHALCTLLRHKNRTAVSLEPDTVRKAIDTAWQSVPQSQQIALLPWIGWAESEYAVATHQPLAHTAELTLLRDVLLAAVIKVDAKAKETTPYDLVGGIALISSFSGNPLATSQTVRPASWLAMAMQSRDLPNKHKENVASELLPIMRFLMQLSVRDTNVWQYRNPQRALGGIREALWDSDQPVPAQALGLVTAVEILRVLGEHP